MVALTISGTTKAGQLIHKTPTASHESRLSRQLFYEAQYRPHGALNLLGERGCNTDRIMDAATYREPRQPLDTPGGCEQCDCHFRGPVVNLGLTLVRVGAVISANDLFK